MSQATLDFTGTAGPAYSPKHDAARLSKQHDRVKRLMLDGVPRTLAEISAATGDPESSVSAQLRHMRKERFGGHTVDKRHRGPAGDGLYEYFVLRGAPEDCPPEATPKGSASSGKSSAEPAFQRGLLPPLGPAPLPEMVSGSFPAATVIMSQRYTTNPRRPGEVIRGAVHVQAQSLVPCAKCGKAWFGAPGIPHAPHWRASVLVDCAGEAVSL